MPSHVLTLPPPAWPLDAAALAAVRADLEAVRDLYRPPAPSSARTCAAACAFDREVLARVEHALESLPPAPPEAA